MVSDTITWIKMKQIKTKYLVVIALLVFILIAFFAFSFVPQSEVPKKEALLFKDPECGCCVVHASYLEQNNFSVTINKTKEMQIIKEKYGIPIEVQSCHTTIIGNYFVEGHVPIEAINKLLAEQPDIDGVALPEMPAGSPGMPGIKKEPFTIYSIKNGEIVGVFMVL